MNILFRADSSSSIGTGHIMRDLVLAKQYPNDNVIFATQKLDGNINHKVLEAGYSLEILESNNIKEFDTLIKKLNIDMIIIDHYGIDYNFEKKLKVKNPKLKIFVLDDTYEKHYCDILLNNNIYGDEKRYKDLVPNHCELRCGANYILLRDEFLEYKKIPTSKDKFFTIFIAMGGTDIQNLNPKILKVLENFDNIKVNLISTNANQNTEELKTYCKNKQWINLCLNCNNVAKLMGESALAIITPSVTANEVYFMGLPFIAIRVADNQNFMVEFCKENKIPVLEEFDKNMLKKEILKSFKRV